VIYISIQEMKTTNTFSPFSSKGKSNTMLP
jgi:hypothetical protein